MSDKQFLADQVKGGLVKIDYTGAVNNKYYMPMPLSTPEAGHDPITVRIEPRRPRKQKKSILL